jgi:hypothetical protein
MQFTGLIDNTGKEIYEDDIIERSTGSVGIVKWRQEYACFEAELPEGKFPLFQVISDSKVIGNTFENPELLKD